jgi:GT2 family glycosyltransferase
MSDALTASVILPCRNRWFVLPEILRSLGAQTIPGSRFEVLVVDDASSDGTQEGLRGASYPFQLKYHRFDDHDARHSVCRVRNAGLRMASNDVVIFLDADIIVGPEFVERHLALHEDERELRVGIGYIYGYGDPGQRTPEALKPPPASRLLEALPGLLEADGARWADVRDQTYAYFPGLEGYPFPWNMAWGGNVSTRRASAVEVGGFDEGLNSSSIEDIEFTYRLFKQGARFVLERQAWGIHHPHPARDARPELVRANVVHSLSRHPEAAWELGIWLGNWGDESAPGAVEEGLKVFLLAMSEAVPLSKARPSFAPVPAEAAQRLLAAVRAAQGQTGPLIWFGAEPEWRPGDERPGVVSQPDEFRKGAALALLGLLTPWSSGEFAGAVVVNYWRCFSADLLRYLLREVTRIASSAPLVGTEPRELGPSLQMRTRDECTAALDELGPELRWREAAQPGLLAFIVERA